MSPNPTLYDGPLAGVPTSGYSYWGFDFYADEDGIQSPVRQDEFINRSMVPVTITLSFNFPTSHPCGKDCLPGMEFVVNAGWDKFAPPAVIKGNTVSFAATFKSGQGFGWVIALWQSINPRLTVTIPKDSAATMEDLGLATFPSVSSELPAVTGLCACWDGSTAGCSPGKRYSNGLLGPWYQNPGTYTREGAFNDCPINFP